MTEVVVVKDGLFSASLVQEGGALTVRLAGTADVVAKKHLEGLFDKAHEHARTLGLALVQVDLHDLVFMNSACLKDVVTWLNKVQTSRDAAGYRVLFLSSAKQPWQRRTLRALMCFAPDAASVEVS